MEVVVRRRAVVGPAVRELHVTAPQLPQVVPGGERHGLEADAALFAQGDEESGFVLMGLGEGIFEGTACVADGVPSHLLGAVEVAQSHIVEALEEGDVDAFHPAHAGLFALADRRPGRELVGHQHVPAGGVGCAGVQHTADGVVVALDLLVREDVPHGGGLQKGQEPDVHRAVFVRQGDGRGRCGKDRADVHPAPRQKLCAEGDAVCRVVVAADGKNGQSPRRKLGEEPVQQPHRLGGRHGLVVEVACQQNAIYGPGVQQGEDLL